MPLSPDVLKTVNKVKCLWRWGDKKEHKGQRVALWTNYYTKTFDHAQGLIEVLKKDFPNAKDDEIEIVIYGGRTKKSVMGIHFDPGNRKIPSSYSSVDQLDDLAY